MKTPAAPTLPPSHLRRELEAVAELRNYHRWIFEEIRPFLGQRIAEIGAGIGTFSQEIIAGHLHSHPASNLDLFEPSLDLHQELERTIHRSHRHLLSSHHLTATAGFFQAPPRSYDSVLMINVLEHIEHEAPLLKQIHDSLQAEGTLIIFVPALNWLFSELDHSAGHYRRYEKPGLRHVFEQNGFTVIKEQYMDVAGVIPWYLINVLGRSRSFNSTLVKLYDRWGIPFTRFIERRFGAPRGKNLLMIGRR